MTVYATIGATALWLLYLWLASAIAGSWLTRRKGYGPSLGLGLGVVLSAVGLLVCLLLPSAARFDRFRKELRHAAREQLPEPPTDRLEDPS
jgi:hypothetical protein